MGKEESIRRRDPNTSGNRDDANRVEDYSGHEAGHGNESERSPDLHDPGNLSLNIGEVVRCLPDISECLAGTFGATGRKVGNG
jgi:hypothetical protein